MNDLQIFIVCFFVWVYHLFVSAVSYFLPVKFKCKDISGKTVLITGGGSGLGRQLAIEFSKHSTRLVLVDVNMNSLLETKKLLDDRGSSVFVYYCDVSDYRKVYELADRVKLEVGDVDILVNNAGIVYGNELLDLSEEKITKTLGVNTLAHFWMCKAFLPAMMEKNEGHILSISSFAGKRGLESASDYSASKFGAIGFAESLELELRQKNLDGIKITIVCPTFIGTGLFAGAKSGIADMLTVDYVAKEAVDGVLRDEETIVLPHFIGYCYRLREFVPRSYVHRILDKTGDTDTMRNFTGRTQNETDNKHRETKSGF